MRLKQCYTEKIRLFITVFIEITTAREEGRENNLAYRGVKKHEIRHYEEKNNARVYLGTYNLPLYLKSLKKCRVFSITKLVRL